MWIYDVCMSGVSCAGSHMDLCARYLHCIVHLFFKSILFKLSWATEFTRNNKEKRKPKIDLPFFSSGRHHLDWTTITKYVVGNDYDNIWWMVAFSLMHGRKKFRKYQTKWHFFPSMVQKIYFLWLVEWSSKVNALIFIVTQRQYS